MAEETSVPPVEPEQKREVATKIRVGDVVRLSAGSPNMLAAYRFEEAGDWLCVMIDEGKICPSIHPASDLSVVLVNPEPDDGMRCPSFEERQLREEMQKAWLAKVPDAVRIPADILDVWEGEISVEARMVSGRGLCVLRRFISTTGLLVGARIDPTGCFYDARYCYPSLSDAKEALRTWDGVGDPGGGWIKEKVSQRLGPAAEVTPEQRDLHERLRLAGKLA